MTQQTDFINKYWDDAVEASKITGIAPERIIAQAGLETGWGKAVSGDFNFFGVKDRDGKPVTTHENYGKGMVKVVDRFKNYSSARESFLDWARLINKRYPEATKATTDKGFAEALKRGGYATDKQYVEKLTGTIASVKKKIPA